MRGPGFMMALLMLLSCVEEGDIAPSELNRWSYFGPLQGLPSKRIFSLYEDPLRRIWIGTNNGMAVMDGSDITLHPPADGLIGSSVYAITEDPNGTVWAGTNNGINILVDGEWLYYPFSEGIFIPAIITLANGNVLIGTDGFGVIEYRLNADAFYQYYLDNSCAACNVINTIFQESSGAVWIGTNAGAKRRSGSSTTTFGKSQGLSGKEVTAIHEDGWGNVWIGTADGESLTRYRNGKLEKVKMANGFSENWIWDLQSDDDGNLWIATVLLGMYRFDGAVMHKDMEHFKDDFITDILKDSRGNLWIGTNFEGLVQYVPK